jgi:(S)-ureidoglycine aminohydrolase
VAENGAHGAPGGVARGATIYAIMLGVTTVEGQRGTRGGTFTLLTPDNRYVSRLPNLPGAKLFKLVTPRLAPARFAEYLVAAPAQGVSWTVVPGYEHFLFGRSGGATIRAGDAVHALDGDGFALLPATLEFSVDAQGDSEVIWLKRKYEAWPGLSAPSALFGRLDEVPPTETAVPGLTRQELIDPADPAYDFNVSLMSFEPEVALHQIEIHDEEHGLYMISGDGDYHLDGGQYPVQSDDFIYMAPYCPQGFRAGPDGAAYLLYKDVYRDGF